MLLFLTEEDDNRIMLGKTVMLPDPINGGVFSRTFLNVTLGKTLADVLSMACCVIVDPEAQLQIMQNIE